MKKIIIGLTVIVLAFFASALVFGVSDIALADTKAEICKGIDATGASCANTNSNNNLDSIVATVINLLSWVVGVVSVIMVIFGGFKYITSAGDSSKVSSAKNTIIYALIGLVIVALAQVIVIFVLDTVTPTPAP